ncbi:MAG: flavodoxin family protein [Planctomycetota bacterium]|nr:MAG: flavodoxin family protein [Planctomycetota bacterium]
MKIKENENGKRRVLFISGTPRENGNSELLAGRCAAAAGNAGADVTFLALHSMNISHCMGCLKCNKLKRCAITADDWARLRDAFIESDAVVFSSPVYFHGVTGVLKNALDRFRSVLHVTFTTEGLIHDPVPWPPKDVAVILTQGAPEEDDFEAPLENLRFFSKLVCGAEDVRTLIAKGLIVAGQVDMGEKRLRAFFRAAGLDAGKLPEFVKRFESYRKQAETLGAELAAGGGSEGAAR